MKTSSRKPISRALEALARTHRRRHTRQTHIHTYTHTHMYTLTHQHAHQHHIYIFHYGNYKKCDILSLLYCQWSTIMLLFLYLWEEAAELSTQYSVQWPSFWAKPSQLWTWLSLGPVRGGKRTQDNVVCDWKEQCVYWLPQGDGNNTLHGAPGSWTCQRLIHK